MTVHNRRAVREDVGTIHRLLQEMAAELGRTIGGTEAALQLHGFGPDPRYRAVLAQEAEQVVGLVLIYPEFSSWRGEVGLFVQDLYVRPPVRGKGVARALLAAAIDWSSDWAPAFMTLMVDHRNEAAQGWYARQGFTLREKGDLLILERASFGRLR